MKKGHSYFDEKMWIKFNQLIAINVSLDAAIFFGYLYNTEDYVKLKHRSKFFKNDYWFICKSEYAKNKLNMCYSRQRRAIQELEECDLIETQLRQGKLKWFRINWKEFILKRDKWVESYSEKVNSVILNEIENEDEVYKEYEDDLDDDW